MPATLKKEDHLVERNRYSGDRAQPAVKPSADKAVSTCLTLPQQK
jgi:hypothetical protein